MAKSEVMQEEVLIDLSGSEGDSLVLDLEKAEKAGGFECLPKGTYSAVVEELEFTTSKNGNYMLRCVFAITDAEYEGRKIFHFFMLSGEGAKYSTALLQKFLAYASPEVPLNEFKPKAYAESGSAIGREVAIKLNIQTQKTGEYAGQQQNRVQDILKAASTGSFL